MSDYSKLTAKELRIVVAKQAFGAKCMIWSVDDQKYYTPREFVKSEVIVNVKYLDSRHYLGNISMFPPEYAIKQELERMIEAQTEVDLFIQRVFSAFELQPIVKTPKKQ